METRKRWNLAMLFLLVIFSGCAASQNRNPEPRYSISYNEENAVPIKATIEISDEELPLLKNGESCGLAPYIEVNKTKTVEYSSATGIVISHDGLVLTNNHVIDGNPNLIQVVFGGASSKVAATATVVTRDEENDLAVIKVESRFKHIAHFGTSKNLKINQTVYYWGYPYGLSYASAGKCFHRGYISRRKVRNLFFSKVGLPRYYMGIRGAPGVSGSGIYSRDGHLVGIMQGYVGGGIHFVAIPIDQVTKFLRDRGIRYSSVKSVR